MLGKSSAARPPGLSPGTQVAAESKRLTITHLAASLHLESRLSLTLLRKCSTSWTGSLRPRSCPLRRELICSRFPRLSLVAVLQPPFFFKGSQAGERFLVDRSLRG